MSKQSEDFPTGVRVFFAKQGRAVYCSHLDLMRSITRAMVRAEIPAWHTRGFNPHMYLTFALPLSLGVTGLCESFDFRLEGQQSFEEIARLLNSAMPEGLSVIKAQSPVFKPKEIFWADYDIDLLCDERDLISCAGQMLGCDSIVCEIKGKKKTRQMDIKPHFKVMATQKTDFGSRLSLRTRAGTEQNLNPSVVLGSLSGYFPSGLHHTHITRTRILMENLVEFY
jgi:radical SAM-linked protein